jgi:L,D-peptidoglycan transpeptidase YkuD (ErfK/YbiS/YcfS/YnhG family)
MAAAVAALGALPQTSAASPRFQVPSSARQLMIVSSPTYNPSGSVATLRAYGRTSPGKPWHLVFGPWAAEIGYGGLRDRRREGDGSTPTGVYAIEPRIYGNRPDPGGLHYAYHRLACGDWWDEDPFSPGYNHFVHVRCGVTPSFAPGSEALWRKTVAYPYLAVIRFNTDPTHRGRNAPGSGIFLHSWVNGPTAGCVALARTRLLAVLRWLRPNAHPAIEIGTDHEVGPIPPPS